MKGRKGKCHNCQAVFQIQLKQQSLKTSPTTLRSPTPDSPATRDSVPGGPTVPPATSERRVPREKKEASKEDLRGDDQRQSPIENSKSREKDTPPQKVSTQPKQTTTNAAKPFNFFCPSCQSELQVPGGSEGKQTICPFCSDKVTIPVSSSISNSAIQGKSPKKDRSELQGVESVEWEMSNEDDPFADLPELNTQTNNPYAYAGSLATGGKENTSATAPKTSKSGFDISKVIHLAWHSYWPAGALSSLAMMAIFFIAMVGLVIVAVVFQLAASGMPASTGLNVMYVIFGIGSQLALCVAGAAATCCCLTTVFQVQGGKRDVTYFALGDFLWRMLGFGILATLLYVVIAAPSVILGCLYLPLLLPILFFAGLFFCMTPFAIADGYSVIDSLSISCQLTTKNFGTMMACYCIGGLIGIAVNVIAVVTFGLAILVLAAVPLFYFGAVYRIAKRNTQLS